MCPVLKDDFYLSISVLVYPNLSFLNVDIEKLFKNSFFTHSIYMIFAVFLMYFNFFYSTVFVNFSVYPNNYNLFLPDSVNHKMGRKNVICTVSKFCTSLLDITHFHNIRLVSSKYHGCVILL